MTLSAFAVGCSAWPAGPLPAQKKKPDDPTPRKDAILKLFVEEFVPITPGKKQIPRELHDGLGKRRPRQRTAGPQGDLQIFLRDGQVRGDAGTLPRRHGQEPRRVPGPAQRHGPRQLERSQRVLRQGDQDAARRQADRRPTSGFACPRRPSGNIAAGPARRPPIPSATTSRRSANTPGARTIRKGEDPPVGKKLPERLGPVSTCTATSGNGASIRWHRRLQGRPDRRHAPAPRATARIASCAAAPTTRPPRRCVVPIAIMPIRRRATDRSDFAVSWQRSDNA